MIVEYKERDFVLKSELMYGVCVMVVGCNRQEKDVPPCPSCETFKISEARSTRRLPALYTSTVARFDFCRELRREKNFRHVIPDLGFSGEGVGGWGLDCFWER